MGPRSAAERELELLAQELEDAEDEAERREIRSWMRDIERDEAEREQWEREGSERGWR